MKARIPLWVAGSVALTFVALAQAEDQSALAVFTSPTCTRDEIKTLRDQVGCVDAQLPASPERRSFDELATRYLADVAAGKMDETEARHQINLALRAQVSASSSPATASAAPEKSDIHVPRGYRRVVINGQKRYCRYESSEYSRAARVEVCLTEEELLAEQKGDSSAAERAHEQAGAGIYGAPSTTGGNAPSPQ